MKNKMLLIKKCSVLSDPREKKNPHILTEQVITIYLSCLYCCSVVRQINAK